jgi:tetratricopeptide (TPR) repeat protein
MRGAKRKKVAQMLPLSPWLLAGIVFACIVIVILLVPSQEKLLARQLSDQEWDKAYATLQQIDPSKRESRPAYYALLDLQLRRRLLAPDDLDGHTALLPEAVAAAVAHGFTEDFIREIEQLAGKSLSAKDTYDILQPQLAQFPAQTQDELYESLAKRALAQAEPVMAAQIYGQYWRTHAGDLEVTFHYVNLARAAAQPKWAIQAIEHFETTIKEPLRRFNPQLARLKVDLLRENNQPVEAFELLFPIYNDADEETKVELFELLSIVTLQAGKSADISDAIRNRAERQQSAVAWRDYAKRAQAAGDYPGAIDAYLRVVRLAPKDGDSALQLARLHEWTERPNQAFDYYLIALERGADEAIERLIELNPAVLRDVELFAALEGAGNRVDQKEYGLTLARLAANLSDFKKASAYYEGILAREPNNQDVLQEYGLMMLDIGNHEEAIRTYSRAIASGTPDFSALVSIAEAQFRAGRFEPALKTYADLLKLNPTRSQMGNYLRLAESMGRIKEATEVLASFMQATDEPEFKDYQKLAYFYGILGQPDRLTETLRSAVREFPDNAVFRKQLLYAYSDNKRFDEAAALLATFPGIAEDRDLTQMYINLLMEGKRYAEVEKFITDELSPELVDELKFNELLASVYYETGNKEAALALYEKLHRRDPTDSKIALAYAQFLLDFKRNAEAKRVIGSITNPSDPLIYKTAAQLHAADNEYREALKFQRKYLATDPPDSGRDWGFLGDILGERGNKPGAQRAYRRAITELLDTLVRLDSTNAPTAHATAN